MASEAAVKEEGSAKQKKKNEDTANEIIREYKRLSGNRGNWESHWQEIAERIWPSQSRLFQEQGIARTQGEKRNEQVFDSTPCTALNRFGAILDSLLTPRNQAWHRLLASDKALNEDRDVRLWFEELNRILFSQRYAPLTNFASQNQLNYKMLGAYGSGCLFVDDLKDFKGKKSGLRYRNIHLSGMYFKENHQGIVDTALRYYCQSARQAMQEWGNKLPPNIREKAKSNPEAEFYFIHCVKPRTDIDVNRADFKSKPWASYYVAVDGCALLDESGYDTFPYAISRYEQVPGEVYGRSPAMDVLPSIKTLNAQKKIVLKVGHRAADPVLLGYDDGILDGMSLKPGAYNAGGVSADGRPLVHALPTGNPLIGKDMMDDERAMINDAFLITLFQILTENPQMTATEVLERTKEKGILIAPTIGRQQSEYLGPLIEREIDILVRQGLVPPMPPLLMEARGEYRIEYESPMSRTARSEEATGFMRTIEVALNVATQAQNPAVLDHFNWDVIIPEMSDIQGVPASWRNSPEQIEQMRQARAEAAQEQAQSNAAPGAAALIKSSAVASETVRKNQPQVQ